MVSSAGKPLAPAFALLGHNVSVSVASPTAPLRATVITCCQLVVYPNLSPLGGGQVGQEKDRAGREGQASLNEVIAEILQVTK